jgi:hypothetical protein
MIFSKNRFPLFRSMLQGFEDRAGSQALQPETGYFVAVADQTFGAGGTPSLPGQLRAR